MKRSPLGRQPSIRPIVLIEWEDSAQAAPQWQWMSEVSPPRLAKCRSIGFLIRDTKTEKALAISEANDFEQVSGVITIPSRCVKRMRKLE
jgi:hypothetical protein